MAITTRYKALLFCSISELVTEIQTRFQVSLKPGVGTGMTFPPAALGSPIGSEFRSTGELDSFSNPPAVSESAVLPLPSNTNNSTIEQQSLHCPLCDESFPDRAHLSQHLREHIGEVPSGYKCTHCQKSFSEMLELQSHMISGDCGFSEKVATSESLKDDLERRSISDVAMSTDQLDYNRSGDQYFSFVLSIPSFFKNLISFLCRKCNVHVV